MALSFVAKASTSRLPLPAATHRVVVPQWASGLWVGPSAPGHAALARTLALSGAKTGALAALRKVEAIAKQRYVSPIEFAHVRFALDQLDLGFRWLKMACDDRAFDVLALKVDPRFDALKSDRRLQALLKTTGLS